MSDLDNERQVLGALLREPKRIPEVRTILSENDFHDGRHRQIFAAVLKVADTEKATVDPLTVAEQLGNGTDVHVMLQELSIGCATPANVGHYAEKVAEAARRHAVRVAWHTYEATDDPEQLRAALDVLASGAPTGSTHNRIELPKVWDAVDLAGARQIEWLARHRLPRGAVSLLVGDEGIGKSLLWVWIVAAITTGNALPAFGIPARMPGLVVLVLTEDDWSTTVRPRLEQAGADLGNIKVICTDEDGSGAPVFPRDIVLIEMMPEKPVFVVVDAWLDTVAAGYNVKDPQQARQALHPWKDLATGTGASILLLTHTNRVDSKNARDKYGITGELRKKARMTLFAQLDDEGNLVVGPEKSNLVGKVPASKFTIRAVQVYEPTEDHDGTVPELVYLGESSMSARDHIEANYAAQHGEDGDDRTEAENWLTDYLTEQGGSAESKAAKKAGKAALGLTDRTFQRAAKSLGLVIESTGFPRVTVWSLPQSRHSEDIDDTRLSEHVATGATGADLHKRDVATVITAQSRQAENNGATDGATGPHLTVVEVCGACSNPLHGGRCVRCEVEGQGA